MKTNWTKFTLLKIGELAGLGISIYLIDLQARWIGTWSTTNSILFSPTSNKIVTYGFTSWVISLIMFAIGIIISYALIILIKEWIKLNLKWSKVKRKKEKK